TVISIPFRRWNYKVEVIFSGRTNYTVNTLVTDSNGSTKYTYTQNKYDPDAIQLHVRSNSRLTEPQRNKLYEVYENINPLKPISLIASDQRSGICAGDIFLFNDTDKLAKGLIEIIY